MDNWKALQNKRLTKENPVIVNSVARSEQAFTATLGKNDGQLGTFHGH